MKKSVPSWQIAGFLFAAIGGTLLHFLFDWSGGSGIVGLFSAVNESIWEHMKLLYYPQLIFAFVEYSRWGKDTKCFWQIKLLGVIVGMVLIPVLYYTYTGALGVSADWFNIAIFFITAGVSFWLETKLFEKEYTCLIPSETAFTLLCMIGIVFTAMTFAPLRIPLFEDPLTGTYGF